MNETTLLDLFKMGGLFMWPLLVFSVAAVTLAVERLIFILRSKLNVEDLKTRTLELLRSGDAAGALDFLREASKTRMGARVLLTCAKNACAGIKDDHKLEKDAETEASVCINSLENGFDYLTAIGSLAPLTGFLGTVSGMIGAFKSIAEATEVNAQIVANGIYEALITTVFGLIIAIIAMIASSIFSHIVDRFASDIETSCSLVISEISSKQS